MPLMRLSSLSQQSAIATASLCRMPTRFHQNTAFSLSLASKSSLMQIVNPQKTPSRQYHHKIKNTNINPSVAFTSHRLKHTKSRPPESKVNKLIQNDAFIPNSAFLEQQKNSDVRTTEHTKKQGAEALRNTQGEERNNIRSATDNMSQKLAQNSSTVLGLDGEGSRRTPASPTDGSASSTHAHLENRLTPEKTSPTPFIDPTMESTLTSVTLDDILRARQVQLTLLKNTPLQKSIHLSDAVPGNNQVYLKFESAHLTGSFKERGAIYKLASLSPEEKERGVVAASAGNHAQAVAYHASRLGIKSTIVMPELTPLAKVAGTKKWGAEVVLFGDSLFASLQRASQICDAENRVFVHPYNDDKIIAGQGTLGIELMEQNPFLDAVIIPIGGGGLIAGTALALKQVNPRIKIFGVEAANMPGMKTSREQKKVVDVPFVRTLADGIAVKSVGDKTLSIIQEYVDDIVTVTENEIAAAVMTLLEKEKTMTEGAGACGVAALLTEKLQLKNKRVCCVLTGGNIDVSVLREIIDRGLVSSGRLARVRITVPDAPGYLARVLTLMATLGCNVSEVEHERAFLNLVGSVSIYVTIQTRGLEHIEQIRTSLKEHGYHHKFVSQFGEESDDQ